MRDLTPPADLTDRDRPVAPPALLSRAERERCIERGFRGLYRWYVDRSQAARTWNPDRSFDWRAVRTDHSPDVTTVLEGFFAVEHYAPDYTSRILHLVRSSHGRANFQMRWGMEESRHADAWENALLFSRARSSDWLAAYKDSLRERTWELPWDDPIHMVLYTVVQERATQLNYINLERVASGRDDKGGTVDPVLARVARTIAIDEAAHYNFFLEGARLFLYYQPEETLAALLDVIGAFAMPAQTLIPEWPRVVEAIYRLGLYGPRQYQRDVLRLVLANLSVTSRAALSEGIKRSRVVPGPDGTPRGTAIWDAFDTGKAEQDVRRMFQRIAEYEAEVGFDQVDPTVFTPNPAWHPG